MARQTTRFEYRVKLNKINASLKGWDIFFSSRERNALLRRARLSEHHQELVPSYSPAPQRFPIAAGRHQHQIHPLYK